MCFFVSDKILDKDGKRETEKRILRERLLARLLHQKQLEKEVIKDMALQWGKNYKPSENLEAANESISECRNGIRILSKQSLFKKFFLLFFQVYFYFPFLVSVYLI